MTDKEKLEYIRKLVMNWFFWSDTELVRHETDRKKSVISSAASGAEIYLRGYKRACTGIMEQISKLEENGKSGDLLSRDNLSETSEKGSFRP